ncbi:BlaI/MecI/CopY family transcriptional regulator [Ferrimonas pelagia]|uniref:BlaI/MecI/CopY family transcriptional regulator n=1 Tax=Ferrimonas pelagia TaxID=1177826 RepID=A0ABP9F0E2_9GAMM
MTEISRSEYEVLEAIWLTHPASAQCIIERLNQTKPWHDKTVKTLLGRMVKKGAIGFEKQGKSYLYFPLLDRGAYQIAQSRSLINRLFGGRVAPMVAGFAKDQSLDKQDIEELKAFIERWEQEHD